MDLGVTIADFELSSPIWNASGARCTLNTDLELLYNSKYTGAVVTKSCTLNKRSGNSHPKWWDDGQQSINSNGLENQGINYYLNFAKGKEDKPIIISVAGLSLEENIKIIRECINTGFTGLIEFNLSCPNIPGKPQIAYDFEATSQYLDIIDKEWNRSYGVKLPPYFDHSHWDTICHILNKHSKLRFVTTINSIGNALIIDPIREETRIFPKEGCGGWGGSPIKPISLSNVYNLRKRLNPHIHIIGVGGIKNEWDIFEMILAGATAVQIGTEYQINGIECFGRLYEKLKTIMMSKGYTKLEDFRNKLKTCKKDTLSF